jgi:hypothetical protein
MEENNQTNTNGAVPAGSTTPDAEPVTSTPAVAVSEASTVEVPVAVVEPVVTAPSATPDVAVTPVPVPVSVVEEVVVATPVAESVMVSEAAPTDTNATALRSMMIKQYAIAIGVVVIMVGGVVYALVQQGRLELPIIDKVTAMVIPTPAAAVVNGVKISMADYEKNKSQIEQSAVQSGADLKDATTIEQIKTQALDVLINTEILRQEATKAGVTVTQEQIDARYAEIVKSLQGEDKLAARMQELNITKESLMSDISSEILIQTYLAKAVDTSSVKITAEDIKATYDKANTNPDSKLPPLDQVSEAIEAQLKQTKEQELINAFIQTVRDAATIDIKVK